MPWHRTDDGAELLGIEVAAERPNPAPGCRRLMSPSRLFYAEDLVEPTFDIRRDGTVAVPDRHGLGFPVVEQRIKKYLSATWTEEAP